MKKSVFLLALATVALWTTARAQTEVEITYQDFYDGLAPYGDWVYVDDYGYCWQPRVEESWRPYTNGSWIYTDAGWTWSSDEEWGWATNHYGRWMLTADFGWLWVPGYEWAPAWVSWRTSDEYVGWAPLPPEATWQPTSGFGPSVDVSFSIGPEYYNFCPVRHLGAPRLRPYIVPARENVAIINNTVNVTKITNVNNVMIFNDGPDFREIQRRTEQPVRWARLERRWDVDRDVVRTGQGRNRVEGDVFRVLAPRVERRSIREERPPKVVATIRREEFSERIGEERRRVWKRTRERNRSAEADLPPRPDGRDQRFEPTREDRDVPGDQRITEGQTRRGSRERDSETLSDEQRSEDQTQDGIAKRARSDAAARKSPLKDHPVPTRNSWKRTSQSRQATSLPARNAGADAAMRRGSHRAGRCDKIRTTETRNANNSADRTNLKNLSKDLLQDSQRRRQHVGPPEKELHAVTARCRSHHKIARRIAKQGKARINSAGKAAQINLNRLKPLHPPGHHRPTVLVFSLHASEANATAVNRRRPSDLAKAAEIRSPLTCSESRPKPQQRHLKNVQQRRQGGENSRQETRSGPPAERRESNVQQQRQRTEQSAQGEKSGRSPSQQQQARGEGQKGGQKGTKGGQKGTKGESKGDKGESKGDKGGSEGEGEGNTQSGEGQGQEGRGR